MPLLYFHCHIQDVVHPACASDAAAVQVPGVSHLQALIGKGGEAEVEHMGVTPVSLTPACHTPSPEPSISTERNGIWGR